MLNRIKRQARLQYRSHLADRVDLALARGDRTEFLQAWNTVSPVLRWDHRPSARRLWELGRLMPPETGAVVEIGSYLGNSTTYLALAGGPVHAVDPHSEESMAQVPGSASTSEQFEANLRRFGVSDLVRYHRMTSVQAADDWTGGPVRLLFIDGLHEYQAVLDDFRAWQPHLAAQHVVLFDDYLWAEVEKAVAVLRDEYQPRYFYVRGGQAIFSTAQLSIRVAGLP